MMYLVNVSVLSRGGRNESLTYFSAQELSEGDLVEVAVRGKATPGFVTGLRAVTSEKASIKASRIGFKKVTRIVARHPYELSFVEAAQMTADYHAVSLGAVLSAVSPAFFLKQPPEGRVKHGERPGRDACVLQADDDDRIVQFKSLTREAFRRKESAFILVPTVQDAESVAEELSRGISEFVFVFHSGRSLRELKKSRAAVESAMHPVAVVATPGHFALMPKNTGLLIVERENSLAYKQLARPFVDFRIFASALAKAAKLQVLLADTLLSCDAVYKLQEGQYRELLPLRWRLQSRNRREFADMRRFLPDIRGASPALSDTLIELVTENAGAAHRTFIFVGRKGLAPTTVCGDCGTVLLCDRCSAPLVLLRAEDGSRSYLCRHCGRRFDAALRCKTCTSWKLYTIGIGTERVEEELKKKFPDRAVIRLDRDSSKDVRQIRERVARFYGTPGAIMVGTEMAIPYLNKTLSACAVASLDELFSIPDYRIHERLMYLMLKLDRLTNGRFLIQTRQTDHPVIVSFSEANLHTFSERELSMRKILSYPPYSVMVKITASGDGKELRGHLEQLGEKFAPYRFDMFPLLARRGGALHQSSLSGLLRVPPAEWPNERIQEMLWALPPSDEIDVNPESFW